MKKTLALCLVLALVLLAGCAAVVEAPPAASPADTPQNESGDADATPSAQPTATPSPAASPSPTEAPASVEVAFDASKDDLGIESGNYYLQNAAGQYLSYSGSKLILSEEPQGWYLENLGDGGFRIREADTALLMLDIENAWYTAGNSVSLFTDTGNMAQQWRLELYGDNRAMIVSAAESKFALTQVKGSFGIRAKTAAGEQDIWSLATDPAEHPYANPEQNMARCLYSDPDLTKTGGRFKTFMIDFLSDDAANTTYWALCNWNMDLTSFAAEAGHNDPVGMDAYAGLQNTAVGKTAIMAFWQVDYTDDFGRAKIHYASRVYPTGDESHFGGEGEGTNLITPYAWNEASWYRMVIHCWDDAQTGHTMVGEWVEDRALGTWTLICYFDTGMRKTFLTGGMSQFMENYDFETWSEVRSFRYKNLYAKEVDKEGWTSLDRSYLSVDSYFSGTGSFAFGAEEDCYWGTACGLGEDQVARSTRDELRKMMSIAQPPLPELPKPKFEAVDIQNKGGKLSIRWELSAASSPQCGYELRIADKSTGRYAAEDTATRPEITACTTDKLNAGTYTLTLTVNDIFGQTAAHTQELTVG